MFLRALLQKDGVSRRSKVTTLFFAALYHPLFPGSRNDSVRYPGQDEFYPCLGEELCKEGAIGLSVFFLCHVEYRCYWMALFP